MTVFDCFKNKEAVFTQSTEVFAVKPESISVLDVDSNDTGDRKTCKMSTKRILWHVGFDVPVFTLVFLLIGLFELGIIPCNKLGFFCNDPGLDYVFNGDTVTTQLLISVLLFVPSNVVLITEYFLYEQPDYILKENFKKKLFRLMKTKFWLIKDYLYGLFVNLAIVEIMKGVTGMPRPTFFDLCRPDALANCTGGEFVSDFACTSSYSWWYQLDSYRSFPSGHTSLSIHAGFFIVWYLQRRAFSWSSKPALLVPLIQLTCIAFAAVASLTRITDHRHHWWDVAVGAVIGFSTVWYTCMILCKNFKWLESYPDTTNNNNNNDRSLRKTPLEDTRLVMTPGTQHLV